jgi:hypothetical protein
LLFWKKKSKIYQDFRKGKSYEHGGGQTFFHTLWTAKFTPLSCSESNSTKSCFFLFFLEMWKKQLPKGMSYDHGDGQTFFHTLWTAKFTPLFCSESDSTKSCFFLFFFWKCEKSNFPKECPTTMGMVKHSSTHYGLQNLPPFPAQNPILQKVVFSSFFFGNVKKATSQRNVLRGWKWSTCFSMLYSSSFSPF